MYSDNKSIQILISLFKEFGVRHTVLSPGTRNVPFVHSVERDPYFNCHSIVDERSAGYFAIGLAVETEEPVIDHFEISLQMIYSLYHFQITNDNIVIPRHHDHLSKQ